MDCKQVAWVVLALCSVDSVSANQAPTSTLPSLWSGQAGFRFGAPKLVQEGVRQLGDIIVEHDIQLIRTGIVKETIRLPGASGTDIVIPEGAKAYGADFEPRQGMESAAPPLGAIEWCVFVPQVVDSGGDHAEQVCIFWENEQRARYKVAKAGRVAFRPWTRDDGMPGVAPRIEEQPIDFGVPFKRQLRLTKLTAESVTFEYGYSDGTHYEPLKQETYDWLPAEPFLYDLTDSTVSFQRAPDLKSVEVKLQPLRRAVVLDVLVGVDGRVLDARVAESSGRPALDEATLKEVKRSWRMKPAMENGKPVEKWGRVSVDFKIKE